jgi:hypothetical protein
MSKDEVMKLMMDSFLESMAFIYSNAGLSEEDAETQIQQGTGSFAYVVNGIYDKMSENGLINA